MAKKVEYYRKTKTLADGTRRFYYYCSATARKLDGEPGTPEFARSLVAAREARAEGAMPPVVLNEGTIGRLRDQFVTSRHWRTELEPSTQSHYRKGLDALVGFEHLPVAELRRHQVEKIIEDRLSKGTNRFLRSWSAAVAWAMQSQHPEWKGIDFNVFKSVKPTAQTPHERWPEEDIAAFLAAPRDKKRKCRSVELAFRLALDTGQRAGDVIRMRWSDYKPDDFAGVGSIKVCQQKTATSKEDNLHIPCTPGLKAMLDAERPFAMSEFIVESRAGKPYFCTDLSLSPAIRFERDRTLYATFSEKMRRAQEFVFGGRHNVWHGLRKSAAARLAELGCSPHEIMAITGHKSLKMIMLYTKQFEQRASALAAMQKLAASRVVPPPQVVPPPAGNVVPFRAGG